MNNSRTKTLAITVSLSFFVVLIRFFYWQVIKSQQLSKLVTQQSYKLNTIYPKRGQILSSDNFPLALNLTNYHLSVYKPNLTQSIKEVFNQINIEKPTFITDNQKTIDGFLSNPNQKWVTFSQLFTASESAKLKIDGVTFSEVDTRVYPEASLAKNILGTLTTIDGKISGISGLEGYYQKQLTGRLGYIWESKDATGKTILSQKRQYYQAVDGITLHTTIDRSVQYYVDKLLSAGVSQYTADSGSIIVLKPDSGAILAMSTINSAQTATVSSAKNPNIADLFEPGSIFKPLVVSMAMDKNVISPNYVCSDCDRPRQIGQYTISNWDQATHPNSSLQDIIKNSDNIGMSGIISRLGLNNFLEYYHSLGLNKKTGIDLLGEAKPQSKDLWPEIDLATASFGQGFAVTQIGMINSFNVLANQGLLVRPFLVSSFSEGSKTFNQKHPQPTRIFSEGTVEKMNQILKYAVENGAVAKFKPKDFEVCGKSGTAQIAVKGAYTESATIASYIGFSPCHDPKFTMIVTINNPKTSPWGSSTAAPIWFELAQILTPLL